MERERGGRFDQKKKEEEDDGMKTRLRKEADEEDGEGRLVGV